MQWPRFLVMASFGSLTENKRIAIPYPRVVRCTCSWGFARAVHIPVSWLWRKTWLAQRRQAREQARVLANASSCQYSIYVRLFKNPTARVYSRHVNFEEPTMSAADLMAGSAARQPLQRLLCWSLQANARSFRNSGGKSPSKGEKGVPLNNRAPP